MQPDCSKFFSSERSLLVHFVKLCRKCPYNPLKSASIYEPNEQEEATLTYMCGKDAFLSLYTRNRH